MSNTPSKSTKPPDTLDINFRHGIQFKGLQIPWFKEEGDLLVIEQMTTEWYQAPGVNLMKQHVGKQGGLHPARSEYTHKVWFFVLTSLQLYYAKMLHATPHYVVRYRDIKCFLRHIQMRGSQRQQQPRLQ